MKIWAEFAGVDGAGEATAKIGAELLPFGNAFANVGHASTHYS